jgi:hypothetical protein
VNFTISTDEYEDETVVLYGGKYLRNQPIILGELDPDSDEYLGDNKKIDSVIIFVGERGIFALMQKPNRHSTTALALCGGYYLQITKLKAFKISSV